MTATTVAEVISELAQPEGPRTREVNERHGDHHGVNLGKLRALACDLWDTDDTAARLLALLVCRPKAFELHDWLVNYVVKKNPHAEALRQAWFADPDPAVASAGWALTTDRVAKRPDGLDLPGLLDVVEAEMVDAPARLQRAMNHAWPRSDRARRAPRPCDRHR